MTQYPHSRALLKRVANRLRMRSVIHRFSLWMLVLVGLYAVALLTARLTGLIPDRFAPWTLIVVPPVALLLAALFHRRVDWEDAARAVDRHTGAKDLYLTLVMLDHSAGQYQTLVVQDAERRASKISPLNVVRFPLERSLYYGMASLGVLLLGIVLLPQMDPFGKVQAAEAGKERQALLLESKKATLARATQLDKSQDEDAEAEESEEVKQAINDLKAALAKMKASNVKLNFEELQKSQKRMAQQWQRINAAQLKEMLMQSSMSQRFGGSGREKIEQWTKELQEGSTESLSKELEDIRRELKELANTKDPAKKAELQQKVKKRLSDLEQFASDKLNSAPLAAALKRAQQQMELGKFDEKMNEDASQAASDSVKLAKLELQEIAQSAKDLKALEEALKAIQMAKRANDQGKLDGDEFNIEMTLEEYEQLLAELGGYDPGTGGPREEGGPPVDEDDTGEDGFKSEQAKVTLQKGKVLLSLKTKGLSDSGEAVKEYQTLVRDIKQGVSEAIENERVPPGYHDGIKTYFDTLEAPQPGVQEN